jgi:protein SCO1
VLATRLSRLVGSPWFWVSFVAIAFGYHIGRAVLRSLIPSHSPPPVLYRVPDFALTDQMGKSFGSADVDGKIWVADFVFTHCPTRCEELTERMSSLQKRLRYMRDGMLLVSFSVDPENDTPAKLYEYGTKHKANHLRWRFLTGDMAEVKRAVVEGFKQPMEKDDSDAPIEDQLMSITHGTRFVLIDAQRRIRGYYEIDDAGIEKLLADVGFLTRE